MEKKIGIYLAGPFFNPPQIELISLLEEQIDARAINLYSPRIHSPSAQFSQEDRKDWEKWQAVLDWNIQAISRADMVIGVLDYLLPPGESLAISKALQIKHAPLSIPDTGTIWELGYAYASGKICIGFHAKSPKQMNLMISHSLQGIIIGQESMHRFLEQPSMHHDGSEFRSYLNQFGNFANIPNYHALRVWDQFSWKELLIWQNALPAII